MNAQPHRILIVDDSPEDREAYRRLILKAGDNRYVVAEAASGEEGLRHCRSAPPDCILLDYTLPDIDGLEFLERLAVDHAELVVSVVFLTGTGNESVAVRAMKQGAEDYLIKRGVTVEGFHSAIHSAMEKAILRRRIEQQRQELVAAKAEADRANLAKADLLATLDLGAIFVRDWQGAIRFWSAGCEAIFGWRAEETVGRFADDLLCTAFPFPQSQMDTILLRDGAWSGDCTQQQRSGTKIVIAARKVLKRDANGRPEAVMESVADVTALRRAESELRRLNADLEARVREAVQSREATQARLVQAEKLGALGQLAGGVAHDFNNIIQAVAGGAAMIERHPDDPDQVKRYSRMIKEASGRGASVTRRLLAFARHGELRAEPVNVASLLDNLREVLAHTMGGAVAVRLNVAQFLPPVLADRGQLETVLINLATNARDAMAGDGLITILADAETVTGGEHPQGLAPGDYVRIAVVDSGAGMDKETLARALEPFFTTKEPGKGTGLGLPIANSFAQQSGGALAVDSEPGRGTAVTIWLPLAPAALTRPENPQAPATTVSVDRRIVLLIDDDDIVREVLAGDLADHGYEVVQADNGGDAIRLLDAGEPVDLIVSDLSMPGMDGVTLIRSAHERRPRLPAILLTGYAGNGTADDAVNSAGGSFILLRKPVSSAELADRIATLIEAAKAPTADNTGGGAPGTT